MNVLLYIIIVRCNDHKFGINVAAAVRKAFRNDSELENDNWLVNDAGAFVPESIWSAVRVVDILEPGALDKLALPNNSRVLWIVLPNQDMVRDEKWKVTLTSIKEWLDAMPSPDGLEPLLLFGDQETIEAMGQFQAKDVAHLGEHRLAHHHLALLALHRARLLLGRAGEQKEKLRLFISHAKVDGVFFANALKFSISQIPELRSWYDAEDIPSGARWKKILADRAGECLLIAIRTESYTRREACLDEFIYALEAGVPIVVVDALLGAEIPPAPLPLCSVPTVRIQDGNTFRVLTAALREHVRILLVETRVWEQCTQKAPSLPPAAWRIWPRLPDYCAIQEMMMRHTEPTPYCIVVADASGRAINAAAGMLQRMVRGAERTPELISISTADIFGDYAVTFAAHFATPGDSL